MVWILDFLRGYSYFVPQSDLSKKALCGSTFSGADNFFEHGEVVVEGLSTGIGDGVERLRTHPRRWPETLRSRRGVPTKDRKGRVEQSGEWSKVASD